MRYDELVKEVAKYKPKTIMEIGSFRCARAERMVRETMYHHHLPEDIMYIGFDMFEPLTPEFRQLEGMGKVKEPDQGLCEHKMQMLGCKYHFIKGNTRETLKEYTPPCNVDFVFVDAGHSIESIRSDWTNLQRFLQKGAVVCFDDYYPNRTDMGCFFLEQELRNQGYYVTFLDATDEERLEGREVRIMKVII